jgi:hypothetical protein
VVLTAHAIYTMSVMHLPLSRRWNASTVLVVVCYGLGPQSVVAVRAKSPGSRHAARRMTAGSTQRAKDAQHKSLVEACPVVHKLFASESNPWAVRCWYDEGLADDDTSCWRMIKALCETWVPLGPHRPGS